MVSVPCRMTTPRGRRATACATASARTTQSPDTMSMLPFRKIDLNSRSTSGSPIDAISPRGSKSMTATPSFCERCPIVPPVVSTRTFGFMPSFVAGRLGHRLQLQERRRQLLAVALGDHDRAGAGQKNGIVDQRLHEQGHPRLEDILATVDQIDREDGKAHRAAATSKIIRTSRRAIDRIGGSKDVARGGPGLDRLLRLGMHFDVEVVSGDDV